MVSASSVKLTTQVCMTGLAALCLPVHASEFEPKEVTSHSSLWSSLALSHGITRHDYREPDPLGRVDPLDCETGDIPTTQVTLRWRGKLTQALPEITTQAQVSYAQGQTDYNGYLQQGITLIPFQARTGNTFQDYRLRVGLPLNDFTQQPWGQHIAPYTEQSWHHWQRNLMQYGETYTWQSTSLGVMDLWTLADFGLPKFSRYTLEADLSVGHTHTSHIDAPGLGFTADLASTNIHSAAFALHYAVTPAWSMGLRYQTQYINLGASPSVAGFKYPGSSNNQQSYTMSLSRIF